MSVTPKPAVSPPPPPPAPAATGVAGAIQRAAQRTGASFEYLLATAKVESNLNPNLKARSSSATGLFQFIEQTWLGMMKTAGRALGFGNYADAISRNSAGRYQVADARMRNEILQLRTDPAANATMAAAFTQQNAAVLSRRIGRPPTEGELYIAHFFGNAGAAQLINAAGTRPQANAAAMFPAAARANRPIFYDRRGEARSVAGVYAELDRRYQVARANVAPGRAPAVAIAQAAAPAAASPGVTPPVTDTAGTTNAFAMAAAQPPAHASGPKADFRSLFHTEGVRGAVAPVVSELWRAPVRAPAQTPTITAQAVPQSGRPLDLFQETRPNVRGLFTGKDRA